MSNEIDEAIDAIASDLVKATLSYTRDSLIQEAQKKLNTTKLEYSNAISGVVMDDDLKGKVVLSGTFPTMLEEGFGPFDEKRGFSKSPKRTKVGNGWYLTIPYRHRTTGSNALPNDVLQKARKLDHKKLLTNSVVRKLGYKPQTSWSGYEWKNSKYDKLQRFVQRKRDGGKRGQYVTFRRVSNNSDPKSWQHPGYSGLKAFDTVEPKAQAFALDYWEDQL